MRHMSTSLKVVAALSLVAEAIGAAALVWPRYSALAAVEGKLEGRVGGRPVQAREMLVGVVRKVEVER